MSAPKLIAEIENLPVSLLIFVAMIPNFIIGMKINSSDSKR